MYQPYTYLIAWTDHNVFYYGVRYSKKIENKLPDQDLWVDYFTSSKYVQEFREEHGEPDRIEIRRVFDSAKKARDWEEKFLRKINAKQRSEWLNFHNGNGDFCGFFQDDDLRKKHSERMKEYFADPENLNQMRERVKNYYKNNPEAKIRISKQMKQRYKNSENGKKITDVSKKFWENTENRKRQSETIKRLWNENSHYRENWIDKMKKYLESDEFKRKQPETNKRRSVAMSKKKWYNNGVINIRIDESEIPPEGFVRGRTKLSNNNGG